MCQSDQQVAIEASGLKNAKALGSRHNRCLVLLEPGVVAPVIPSLSKLKQQCRHEFEDSLSYYEFKLD